MSEFVFIFTIISFSAGGLIIILEVVGTILNSGAGISVQLEVSTILQYLPFIGCKSTI